ncbi:hypothetical protein [Sulfitobacter sp.]|uniref:hypothetical protein n=1 Tax=Sulfitobacter sp. TaxID=1903071 RepID=UPI0032996388
MKLLITTAIIGLASTSVLAEPLTLTLADPQPEGLQAGLSVAYATGAGGRDLDAARSKLTKAKPGAPLRGLSYLDTDPEETVLTSGETTKVAADISGYVHFEEAGIYTVDFFSNDGLDAKIGGQQVALADEVRGCERTGEVEVEVPSAGWYAVEATYFQRKGSACLMMDWDVSGKMRPVPDDAFGFTN